MRTGKLLDHAIGFCVRKDLEMVTVEVAEDTWKQPMGLLVI